jgi:hypothetical protein
LPGPKDYNCNGTIEYLVDTVTIGQRYTVQYHWYFTKRIGDTEYRDYCTGISCSYIYNYGNWYCCSVGTDHGCVPSYNSYYQSECNDMGLTTRNAYTR